MQKNEIVNIEDFKGLKIDILDITFKIENIHFEFLENENTLNIDLSMYDYFEERFMDFHQIVNLKFSINGIRKLLSNLEPTPSIEETILFLFENSHIFKYLRFEIRTPDKLVKLIFGIDENINYVECDFECEKVTFEVLPTTQKPVAKYLSSDVTSLELKKKLIPSARKIKGLFKKYGIEVHFVEYWGSKLNIDHIKHNLNGVSIINSETKSTEGIQMQLHESLENVVWTLSKFTEDETLWQVLTESIIPEINFQKLMCGNMEFSKKEWIEKSNSENFNSIEYIQTLET